jgi:hypothetical protein
MKKLRRLNIYIALNLLKKLTNRYEITITDNREKRPELEQPFLD